MLNKKVICIGGVRKVSALVEELASEKLPREKKRLVNQILTLFGDDRAVKMTPGLLSELVAVHSQCPLDQKGKCALTVFAKSLCWELNQLMGCADEVDAAFRRVDELCAARPLTAERFDREE
jgi:hypothetical protein